MPELPPHVQAYRRSPVFTEETLPAAFRENHATKAGVWGRLHVVSGDLVFTDAEADRAFSVSAGQDVVIEPEVRHRVAPAGAVSFFVEFFR